MTEVLPILVTPQGEDGFDFTGVLAPNTKARIIDVITGKDLGPNKPGELLAKSPGVRKNICYLKVDAEKYFLRSNNYSTVIFKVK